MKNVFIFSNAFSRLNIPKAQVTLFGDGQLPAICSFADGKKCGVATEYLKSEDSYLVDTDKGITFAGKLFDEAKLPTKVGEPLYIEASTGKLTKEKGSNLLVGEFVGCLSGAVLFRL